MALPLARRSLLRTPALHRSYASYRSPYAPRYASRPNFHGITTADATKYAVITSGFGLATGLFAVYFFGEVPRVREDILAKLPVVGEYWQRSIPPEDNPF